MKTFTIEKETNNITAHRTSQEAEAVTGAEHFATAAEFANVATAWPSSRLIEIWNSLPGATAITNFKDRKTAITRIWNAIQGLGEPVAPRARRTPRVVPANAKPARKTTRSKPKSKAAPKPKSTRQGSKTEKIVDLLKRPGGASLREIMKASGWQAHSVRGFISGTLSKKLSLTVVSAKGPDGERTYSIGA